MSAQCRPHCAGSVIIAVRLTASFRQRLVPQLSICKKIIPCASPSRLLILSDGHCICLELPMSSAVSQSLINLLLESGVQSREEAAELALNLNGGSWVGQVLDSGKVDEQRFLGAIGNFFRVPVISLDAKKIDRATLSVLPSRFVFQHQILPIEVKENSVVLATYDLFNSIGRQLAAQLLKKPAEWVLVPRAQLLRAMKTLYGVGAETFDEILKTNRPFEVFHDTETAIELNDEDPEASVEKFVNQIIREAIFERATDIHVESMANDLPSRYRIDRILHEVAVPLQLL